MRKRTITSLLSLLILATPMPIDNRLVYVQSSEILAPKPVSEIPSTSQEITHIIEEWPTRDMLEHLYNMALIYNTDPEIMIKVIECESGWQNIQSHVTRDGVREDSWGIAQIHLPSNSNVTKEQSLNPHYSIRFMAQKFSEGKQSMWTCYNLI